jgi:hypothetical protein
MILMRANPFRGPLEGVGPENRDFFWPGVKLVKLAGKKTRGCRCHLVCSFIQSTVLQYNQLVLRIRYKWVRRYCSWKEGGPRPIRMPLKRTSAAIAIGSDHLEVYARYEIKDINAFKSTKDTYVRKNAGMY